MNRPPFLAHGRASPLVSTDSYEVIDTSRAPMSDTDLDQLTSGWPTTKRFARSRFGTDAAWRDSVDYANPIEHVKAPSRLFDRLWWVGTVVLLILLGLRVDDLLVAVMHK